MYRTTGEHHTAVNQKRPLPSNQPEAPQKHLSTYRRINCL